MGFMASKSENSLPVFVFIFPLYNFTQLTLYSVYLLNVPLPMSKEIAIAQIQCSPLAAEIVLSKIHKSLAGLMASKEKF